MVTETPSNINSNLSSPALVLSRLRLGAPIPQSPPHAEPLPVEPLADETLADETLLGDPPLDQPMLHATASERRLDHLLALLRDAQAADDLSSSWKCLCGGLGREANCDRVALGIANRQGACHLVAISDSARIDRRSEMVLATEGAMDEAIRAGDIAIWNAFGTEQPPIFRRLARLACADAMAAVPLRNGTGKAIGVLLFYGQRDWVVAPVDLEWLTSWQQPLADFIELLDQARGNLYSRLLTAGNRLRHHLHGRLLMITFALAALALVLPIPYKVKCECSVEPVLRRFMAAPFAGTLDRTFVEVGEVVHTGQVLAAMGQRELHWELAGLDAEHAAAKKKRDSALAGQDGAAVQLASLEVERLNTKIQTLRSRVEHLQVQCPIDGIVVSGDLKRTEGAPLAIGQTLFEIAPLEQMIAELKVPQEEIAHLREGLPVDLQLDAFPRQVWSGTIAKIHPRAELCDGYTAFIAEVRLDNIEGSLRPGMSGQARIKTRSRSLGWIYFHRPINALAQRIGW